MRREPGGGHGGGVGQASVRMLNRLYFELTSNWTNGRIWIALILFWAVIIELRLLAATNDEFQIVLKVSRSNTIFELI